MTLAKYLEVKLIALDAQLHQDTKNYKDTDQNKEPLAKLQFIKIASDTKHLIRSYESDMFKYIEDKQYNTIQRKRKEEDSKRF